MTKEDDIKSSYFCFLMELIGYENKNNPYENFGVLLIFLNSIEYQWDNPMDENRMYDGLNLRYLYSLNSEYDYNDILDALDNPCSILEMIIALAYKIEVDIACNPDYINRTGYAYESGYELSTKIMSDIHGKLAPDFNIIDRNEVGTNDNK